jgi:hypothetical protein
MAEVIESMSGGVVAILFQRELVRYETTLFLLTCAYGHLGRTRTLAPAVRVSSRSPFLAFAHTVTTQRTLKALAHKAFRVVHPLPPFPVTLPPFLFPPFCTHLDMSDVEDKKSGYRLEYAKNNRAKCKGSFP